MVTSAQAPDAENVSGANTYRLQFNWKSFTGTAHANRITLNVTLVGGGTLSQDLDFSVINTNSPAWATQPADVAWPTVVTPDLMTARQETDGKGAYRLGLATGEVQTGHTLPGYSPNVAPMGLVYNSAHADKRPIFLYHYELNPASPTVPATVAFQLTLNGFTGAPVIYDTSLLNPGDILHVPLQAEASQIGSAPTGRYNYQITATPAGGTPTTTPAAPVTILDPGASAFGPGWSLSGLDRLWPIGTNGSGGAILEMAGGLSLWFAPNGSGGFIRPAGDFVTLTLAWNAGQSRFIRTLTDGTKVYFYADGRQDRVVDRNNNTSTYTYTDGKLTSIQDPNGAVTSFLYPDGSSLVQTVRLQGPITRDTTLAYNAGRLASITEPDPDLPMQGAPSPVTAYDYDGTSARLRVRTDPDSRPTTFAYDSAGRATTVTRPDYDGQGNFHDDLVPLQTIGIGATAAVLAVQAEASYFDGLNTWPRRLDWLGFGQASQSADPLGDMTVYHRDQNGLAWLRADPLARRTRSFFDGNGNPLKIALPDDNFEQYTYNGNSQPLTHRDPRGNTTTYAYTTAGSNLQQVTYPDPDGPGVGDPSPVATYSYWSDGLLKTSTDPRDTTVSYANDGTTAYQYDPWDRPTRITCVDDDDNPNNNPAVVFDYDDPANTRWRTDERGNTTTFQYDNLGRLLLMKLPDDDAIATNNPVWKYKYDAAGNRTEVTDPRDQTTTSTYDGLNRLLTTRDPLGHLTTNTYDAAGLLKQVEDALHHFTTYDYDAANRLCAITNAEGEITSFGYDAAGQRTGTTVFRDMNNQNSALTTAFSYDLRGRLLTITDPLNNRLEYSYDAAGNQIEMKEYAFDLNTYRTTTYGYDNLDRRTSMLDALGHLTLFRYDAANNLQRRTDPDPDGAGMGVPAPMTTFSYDARNRLKSVEDPLSHFTIFQYDAAGNRTQVIDGLGRITTYGFDAQDRLHTITQPDPDGPSPGGPLPMPVTTITYDVAGRRASVIDPADNTTIYGYDDANRLHTVTDPYGRMTVYDYDEADRLTQITDRRGRVREFIYDMADRLMEEDWITGTSLDRRLVYDYDDAGRLIMASDFDTDYVYEYDNASRLTTLTNGVGPANGGIRDFQTVFGYNGFHDRTSLTDSQNGHTDFSYDAAHRLTAAALQVTGVTDRPQVTFGYDDLDRLTGLTRRLVAGGPNISTVNAYDAASRVTTITHSKAAGQLSQHRYTLYDAADQLKTYVGPDGTSTFTYDNTGQLTAVAGPHAETYTYADANGNRQQAGPVTYDPPAPGNRLVHTTQYDYQYDEEGNLVWKKRLSDNQVTTYTWDYRNRLTGVTVTGPGAVQVAFTYDVFDRRVGKAVNGEPTWTVYDGANPYADFDAAGAVTDRYLYGPAVDFLLARLGTSAGSTQWYLSDRLGSVRQVVTTAGAVLNAITYESFGNILSEMTPGEGSRFRYTGREYDAELGLYYYRARHYDAATGRFLSEDPIGYASGDSNPYRYVLNDSINKVDPTGLSGAGVGTLRGTSIEGSLIRALETGDIATVKFILDQVAKGLIIITSAEVLARARKTVVDYDKSTSRLPVKLRPDYDILESLDGVARLSIKIALGGIFNVDISKAAARKLGNLVPISFTVRL